MNGKEKDKPASLDLDIREAQALLSEPEDELFGLLVPEPEKRELHSFEGVVARGKLIFRTAFMEVRDQICTLYKRQGAAISDEIDVLALVLGVIGGQVLLAGIPVVPMAALIVKIGLSKLCVSWSSENG